MPGGTAFRVNDVGIGRLSLYSYPCRRRPICALSTVQAFMETFKERVSSHLHIPERIFIL